MTNESTEDEVEKFEIKLPDGRVLSKHDTVEHIDYGPMVVDQIRVGPYNKKAQLRSETGPEMLEVTDETIREQWGDELHFDPLEVIQGNPSVEMVGLSLPESDLAVEADLKFTGDNMDDVEVVAMHAKDQIIRAMQALEQGENPEDVDGIEVSFDWEQILASSDE